MQVQPYSPAVVKPGVNINTLYNVTVLPKDSAPRSFLGNNFPQTWDNTVEPCLYVGNSQGGPSGEVPDLTGSVIEGRYTEYMVNDMFATDFKYSRIEGTCAN